MKKFIVFAYDQYYPEGGLNDVSGSFDTIEDAHECVKNSPLDFKEIVDRDTWQKIERIGFSDDDE